jgi:hypothetical protein
MATTELAQLENVTMEHYNAPVTPAQSLPAAQSLINRLKVIDKPVPLPVQRFMDRMSAPKGDDGLHDKLSRDLYSSSYQPLLRDKQAVLEELKHAIRQHRPGIGHAYTKAGLTFAQARHVLVQTYSEMGNSRANYPQDIRHKLSDFATGLEKDLDDAAKRAGFYPQYSEAVRDLKESIKQNRMRGTQQ